MKYFFIFFVFLLGCSDQKMTSGAQYDWHSTFKGCTNPQKVHYSPDYAIWIYKCDNGKTVEAYWDYGPNGTYPKN